MLAVNADDVEVIGMAALRDDGKRYSPPHRQPQRHQSFLHIMSRRRALLPFGKEKGVSEAKC